MRIHVEIDDADYAEAARVAGILKLTVEQMIQFMLPRIKVQLVEVAMPCNRLPGTGDNQN